MTEIPEDAQRSEDGNYWWDGSQWQPVGQDDAGAAASGEATGEVTPEQLEPVGDTGPEPGNEEAVTEQTRPYFAGFDGAEDLSEAEHSEVLDDSQFAGEEA